MSSKLVFDGEGSIKMTAKQRSILVKYLTQDRIDKLATMSYDATSSLIDLIIHFRSFHPVCGEMCSIPFLTRNPTKEERTNIENYVNANKSLLGLVSDEYAELYQVNYIPNCKNWFVIRQTWFKGMSNSPTHEYVKIFEDYSIFEGIYNVLFDAKIFSIEKLMNLYVNELQQTL